MQRKTAVAAVAASALAAPAAADAHVPLQPNTAAAGAFTVENVRVPNERDKASTVKVDLQLPHGFVFASYSRRRSIDGPCVANEFMSTSGTRAPERSRSPVTWRAMTSRNPRPYRSALAWPMRRMKPFAARNLPYDSYPRD